jgi:hypothetical protein
MTILRRFTPPTQTGILHVQESQNPDEVVLKIENCSQECIANMTQAQFRELCRLGVPSPYDRDQDTVRFQPAAEVTFSYKE